MVDLILLLRLPELIHPTQGIGRSEHVRRKRVEQPLEFHAMLGGEGDLQERVVRPEDLRKHALGATRSERPHILAGFLGQLLGFAQAHCHPTLWFDQEFVLGQEAGEQHPVPVFVRALRDKVLDAELSSRLLLVAKLAGPRAELVARLLVFRRHVLVETRLVHGQRFEGGTRAGFGHVARLDDHALELASQITRQRRHSLVPFSRSEPVASVCESRLRRQHA